MSSYRGVPGGSSWPGPRSSHITFLGLILVTLKSDPTLDAARLHTYSRSLQLPVSKVSALPLEQLLMRDHGPWPMTME